jgi:hypothetical protein
MDEVETFDDARAGSPDLSPDAGLEESPEGEDPRSPTVLAPPVPGGLLPLVWFNAAFDACMTPLGPLGRILCGRSGRSFLGSLGLLGLAAALALYAAFRMGWTW